MKARKIKQWGGVMNVEEKDLLEEEIRNHLKLALATQVKQTADTLVKKYYVPIFLEAAITKRFDSERLNIGWRTNVVYCGPDSGYFIECVKDWLGDLRFKFRMFFK